VCILRLVGWVGPVLCALISQPAGEQPVAERSVVLHVHVVSHEGKALADIPLRAQRGSGDYRHQAFARTDAKGRADLRLDVPTDTQTVSVSVQAAANMGGESPESLRERFDYAREILFKYETPLRWIELAPGREEYTIEFTFRPALKITGRLVTGAGAPVTATVVYDRPASSLRVPSPDGRFEIGGLPSDRPSEFYVLAGKIVVPVAVRPPLAQTDLGDIVIPEAAGNATVQITDINDAPIRISDRTAKWGVRSVALVSSDGAVIRQGTVRTGTYKEDAAWVRECDTLTVPAGTYLVTCGLLDDLSTLALIRAIRSGRDFSGYGIPRVTVREGEHAVFPIDFPATYRAQQEAVASPANPGR
jgi:hypothetical protein